MNAIFEFFKTIANQSWFKVVIVTLCAALIIWLTAILSGCGISRRSVTYGTVKKNYTTYDTIKMKTHAKIPKNYEFEEQ